MRIAAWCVAPLILAAAADAQTTVPTDSHATVPVLWINDAGARYPLTIDTIAQQAYLKASNTDVEDLFGFSVSVSGDTIVIGTPFEDSQATDVNGDGSNNDADASGAAYVFRRRGSTWIQEAYLKASNTGGSDYFGISVSISGDTIVVGAFQEASDATGVDGDGSNNDAGASGAAYVFTLSGTSWSQEAYLKASNTGAGDSFGTAVSVSGDTVVVGAPGEGSNATAINGDQSNDDATNSGAVYVFTRSGTSWSQEAYLKASNSETNDFFGASVSISGDTVVVGARGEDSNAVGVDGDGGNNDSSYSGAAYIFVRTGATWSQEAYLKATNAGAFDEFGVSVSASDETVVVGAFQEASDATGVDGDGSNNDAGASGAAYVFVRTGTSWSQEAYLKASNTGLSDYFGYAVSVSGNTAVVGSYREDSEATGVDGDQTSTNGTFDSGAGYVYARSGTTWSQKAYLKASNTGPDDWFGYSVAVSDDTVVAGAIGEASNATGVGGDQSNDAATGSGAAYVFDLDAPIGVPYCTPAVPNSTGRPGRLTVHGSALVSDDDLVLVASDLPSDPNIGYFIMGTGQNTFIPPGSDGPICVAPGIQRFLPPVSNTNELPGGFARSIGTMGPVSGIIAAGSTWNFQAWHRDFAAGGSNLTDAVSVAFN